MTTGFLALAAATLMTFGAWTKQKILPDFWAARHQEACFFYQNFLNSVIEVCIGSVFSLSRLRQAGIICLLAKTPANGRETQQDVEN